MPVARLKPMSVEEFLAWEHRQELRYEFDGVQPVAMTGDTVEHTVIAFDLVRAFDDRLKPPCRAYRGDLKVMVAGRIRYPDALITCAPVPRGSDTVPEPLIVFEVLSSSTEIIDRNVKSDEYFVTPSIQRYVMLSPTAIEAIVLSRAGDDWAEERLTGRAAILHLPEVGVSVPLAEIYRRVDIPD